MAMQILCARPRDTIMKATNTITVKGPVSVTRYALKYLHCSFLAILKRRSNQT